jgi:bifunctional enzyme CysN/CysC
MTQDLLRLLTCGSVDDGKSTLIGRLLRDADLLPDDQLAALEADSKRHGTTGGAFDPALVTDGLSAEREQGITIDVAYRYFATGRRAFILADTPGHEQYTRNMVSGASTADLAIILVDAQHGVRTQTRRHAAIVSLLGIRHLVLAINKMDLVDWRQDVYEAVREEFLTFASRLTAPDIQCVPIAALPGDNIVHRSTRMPWYGGATLLHLIESVHITTGRNAIDLRLPIQRVSRPSPDFRGYQGTVASGLLRTGDDVVILPSRAASTVRRIYQGDEIVQAAPAGVAVTVTLDTDIDAGRGDLIVHARNQPRVTTEVEAMIVWMSPAPLAPGARYLSKHLSNSTLATVARVDYRLNVEDLRRAEAQRLQTNDIGRCVLELDGPIAWDTYERNRATGAFILIDRLTADTVAAGMIIDRLPKGPGVDRWKTQGNELVADLKGHSSNQLRAHFREFSTDRHPAPSVLLTGLSGAGKSTIAALVGQRLREAGQPCVVLDGDDLRAGLNRDLAFSRADRRENLRRLSEVARLFNAAGLVAIVPVIAPFREDRALAREIIGAAQFVEVWVDAPLDVCESRDPKGLYRRARSGDLQEFTGVSSPFEPPEHADLILRTTEQTPEACAEAVVDVIRRRRASL